MLKVLLVVVLFAAVTYALIRVIERRGVAPAAGGRTTRPSAPKRPPARPVAPDDDDDFLRDLDRKRRHPEDPDTPTGS